jgi:DNA-directed RNA polymerase specialized sigma24 family protein
MNSITFFLNRLQEGDRGAAQHLWERYYHRLIHLARSKLRDAPRRAADEEDVALSSFDSFCRDAEAGRFPRLQDRNDLWQVLALITTGKARDLVRTERRAKRGGGTVLDEGAVGCTADSAAGSPLEQARSKEPSAEDAAELGDLIGCLLTRLEDSTLRAVAIQKLAGRTNVEIATELNCSARTVDRKLNLIRRAWEAELTV